MPDSFDSLKENVRYLEKEVETIKKDLRDESKEMESLIRQVDLVVYKVTAIEESLQNVSTTLSKDTGWRGFFIDFIKAAVQIAALVGAGKFIL